MKKFLCLFISIFTMLVLASCGNSNNYDLNKDVNVTLNVNTNIDNYEVATTYGVINKVADNKYNISLDSIKSFNVSISKKEYATKDIYIDSKELINGDITKNVTFGDIRLVNVRVNVDGTDDEVKVMVGNTELTKVKGKYVGEFKKADITDLSVSSPNCEPYIINFSDNDIRGNALDYNIYLTKKGTKLVEILDWYDDQVLTDDEQILDVIHSGINTCYISIPKDFSGKIYLNDNNGYKIPKDIPTYGFKLRFNQNVENFITIDSKVDLYYEDLDGKLNSLYINDENKIYLYDMEIVRFWYQDSNENFRYLNYNDEKELSIKDFKIAEIAEDSYIYHNYGLKIEDQKFMFDNVEVTIKNGILHVSDPNTTYITTPKGESISIQKLNLHSIKFINNKVYKEAYYFYDVNFELNFYDSSSNKINVKEITLDSAKIENGTVKLDDFYNHYRNVVLKDINDKIYYATIGTYNVDEWTLEGNILKKSFVVKETFIAKTRFNSIGEIYVNKFEVDGKKYKNSGYVRYSLNETKEIKVYYFNRYNDREETKIINVNFKDYELMKLMYFINDKRLEIEIK